MLFPIVMAFFVCVSGFVKLFYLFFRIATGTMAMGDISYLLGKIVLSDFSQSYRLMHCVRCVISFVTYFYRKCMVYNEMNFGNVFNCSMRAFFVRN